MSVQSFELGESFTETADIGPSSARKRRAEGKKQTTFSESFESQHIMIRKLSTVRAPFLCGFGGTYFQMNSFSRCCNIIILIFQIHRMAHPKHSPTLGRCG